MDHLNATLSKLTLKKRDDATYGTRGENAVLEENATAATTATSPSIVNQGAATREKPLPELPSHATETDQESGSSRGHPAVRPTIQMRARSERSVQVASSPMTNVFEPDRTEDSTLETRWAPAITHETVRENVHEHEERRITREIHQHHVFHRILPIVDVEVLPAVHYVEIGDQLRQVPEEQLPAGTATKSAQRLMEKAYKKALPKDSDLSDRRQFTARTFTGTEGDYKESTSADGVVETESWWVHRPELEEGAKRTGQTRPIILP